MTIEKIMIPMMIWRRWNSGAQDGSGDRPGRFSSDEAWHATWPGLQTSWSALSLLLSSYIYHPHGYWHHSRHHIFLTRQLAWSANIMIVVVIVMSPWSSTWWLQRPTYCVPRHENHHHDSKHKLVELCVTTMTMVGNRSGSFERNLELVAKMRRIGRPCLCLCV